MLRHGAVALALVSCQKEKVDVDAINALVAPKHTAKLKFVQRDIRSGYPRALPYTLAAPQGWKTGGVGAIRPPDVLLYGDSSIWVRSSCDGESPCVRENWNKLIDAELDSRFVEIVRDERSPNRRIVEGRTTLLRQDHRFLDVHWWDDNSTEYFTCTARLAPEVVDSATAFEKACQSVIVHPH
ncbi:MAG: hypothetical protein ACTHU0_26335 [Kofleriaceae bacterium]